MAVSEKANNAVIGKLFVDYGVTDKMRYQSYCDEYKETDTDLLVAALKKVIQTSKFFPTKADIYEAIDSIYRTITKKRLALEWDEAWNEIFKAISNIGPYRVPQWSTEEIKIVVNTIGWQTICEVDNKNLNTLRSQMREMYNGICSRKKEQGQNQTLLQGTNQYKTIESKIYKERQSIIARSRAKLLNQ